jgi:hypothetical protein
MTQLGPVSLATMVTEADRRLPHGRHVAIGTRTVAGFTSDVVAALCRAAEAMTSPSSVISRHHFHGTAARIPVEDTAFAYRTPHLMAEFVAQWEPDDPRGGEHGAWADALSRSLAPVALRGGYVNLLGPEAADQIPHVYGPNTARLQEIKTRFDPDAVFTATPLPR